MNCPACGMDDSKVIRTERGKKEDRRRHQCNACVVRWSTIERVERGSISSGATPPQIAPQTAISGGSGGALYSGNESRQAGPDPISGSSLQSERERARSEQHADFAKVLKIFTDRWERSYRRPYPVSPADRSQLGRFMRQHGNYLESFAVICDRYVSDRRQFTIDRSASHSLKFLVTTGLTTYGGTPRESAEAYAARLRREHEARKLEARRPPANGAMRDLITELANKAAVG